VSGKGSAPRPKSVEDDVYSANWGIIDWSARENEQTEVPNQTNKEVEDGK
jgi:hypothetical protein